MENTRIVHRISRRHLLWSALGLCLCATLVALGVALDLTPASAWTTLGHFKSLVQGDSHLSPEVLLAVYIMTYSLVGAFCLPGTGVLNLTGAGLFDPFTGLVAICFSRAAGGLLACVAVRSLFRDRVQARFSKQLASINQGMAREGGFYLFALRLVPGLPFPVTNMVMGLTTMRLFPFFWITLVASVPGTLVTINAARQIKSMTAPSDLLSMGTFLSLALIGILPFVLKRGVAMYRSRALVSAVRGRV
ncbi:MAG: TVP38/TMEM64 family protein [Desulfovibrionales bacterium]